MDGELKYMRALVSAFAAVAGNEKSWMLRPVNMMRYSDPCPGKFPAIGVKPWMYLAFQAGGVCVSKYSA